MKYRSLTLFASLAATLLLEAGCSPSISGGPNLSQYQSFSRQYFASGFGSAAIGQYNQSSDASEKSDIRNRIVLSALGSIDTEYGVYERSLMRESQEVPLVATLASLSLSGAGTLVASSVAKTALAATDTGIKAPRRRMTRMFWLTKQSSFCRSRCERTATRSGRISHQARPRHKPVSARTRLIDVENYASAGTIAAGLIGSTTRRRRRSFKVRT